MPAPGVRRTLLIDPVVDGNSGEQSKATQQFEARLADLAGRKYRHLSVQPSRRLIGRVTARGAGSRENLIGSDKDDLSDALDRRIAFRFVSCALRKAQTAHR